MATDTQVQGAAAQSPLDKAHAAHAKATDALNAVREQERALQSKRGVIASVLARDGKLSREQRSELASVNRQIKALATPLKRAQAAYDRARAKLDAESEKVAQRNERKRLAERAKADAATARAKAANQRKLDRRIAAFEAKELKKAGAFAQLPDGAKPSKAASRDDTKPAITHGYVTKEGRGKSARWVLVVTDSYGMAVLPLQVTGELPVKGGAFIPPEALKAIDKTGAFRITAKGGVQPVKVTTEQNRRLSEPEHPTVGYGPYDPTRADGWARTYTVVEVGTAYMLPEQAPSPGRFPDHTQFVSKPPAKANALEWAVSPSLLKQMAEAVGSGSVVVTFDLSKVGKASEGRQVVKPVSVQAYDSNTSRPVEGASGILMPVRLAARK